MPIPAGFGDKISFQYAICTFEPDGSIRDRTGLRTGTLTLDLDGLQTVANWGLLNINLIANAILGRSAGEQLQVDMDAVDGFGPAMPSQAQTYPRSALGGGAGALRVGDFVSLGPTPEDSRWVSAIDDQNITFDTVHPYAGCRARILLKLLAVEPATGPAPTESTPPFGTNTSPPAGGGRGGTVATPPPLYSGPEYARLGPVGGPGSGWDDLAGLNSEEARRLQLSRVVVHGGDIIDGFQAVYVDRAMPAHGGDGGAPSEAVLDGDPIVALFGFTGVYFGTPLIARLGFRCRSGRVFGPYGGGGSAEDRQPFDLTAPPGAHINAFFGRTATHTDGRLFLGAIGGAVLALTERTPNAEGPPASVPYTPPPGTIVVPSTLQPTGSVPIGVVIRDHRTGR